MSADRDKSEQPHLHAWMWRQNVTACGYALSGYEACACGAARLADAGTTQSAPEPSQAATEAHGAAPAQAPVERDDLWSAIDWTLWGSGMGDTFREPLADKMLAALDREERAQALAIMVDWRGRRGKQASLAAYEDLKAEQAELRAEVERLAETNRELVETHNVYLGVVERAEAEAARNRGAARDFARMLGAAEAKVAQHEATIRALTTRINLAEPKLDDWRSWGRAHGYGLGPGAALDGDA